MPPHRIPFPAALGDAGEGWGSKVTTESRRVGSGSINTPRERWGLLILWIYCSTISFYLTNASLSYSLSCSTGQRRRREGKWGYNGIADGWQRRHKYTIEKVWFVNSLNLLFHPFILSNQYLLTVFPFLQHWATPTKGGGVRLQCGVNGGGRTTVFWVLVSNWLPRPFFTSLSIKFSHSQLNFTHYPSILSARPSSLMTDDGNRLSLCAASMTWGASVFFVLVSNWLLCHFFSLTIN